MDAQHLIQASFQWPWDVVRAPNGAVVMDRGGGWRNSLGGAAVALALIQGAIYLYPFHGLTSASGHPVKYYPGTILVASMAFNLLIWGLALYTLLLREEWQARPGVMAMRKRICGLQL